MKRVLVLNGSPRGQGSNTMQLTQAFLDGMARQMPIESEILPVYSLNIRPCTGCFSCWNKTPGKCVLHDDMDMVLQKTLEADVIIWSFPLYYFGIPSQLKALMDRQLPLNLPFMLPPEQAEHGGHPTRFDLSDKQYVVISTCGFYTAQGNYDGVNHQFNSALGSDGYTAIYCGQGELFRMPELRSRTQAYLQVVQQAGAQFARGSIGADIMAQLAEPLYPREVFEAMANASWGIEPEEQGAPDMKPADPALFFTKQMAALYNPKAWPGKDLVVEFHYTDVDKTYEMVLGKTGSSVLTENFLPSTTQIKTPLSIWKAIAKGEISGQQALMERKYSVTGEFDLMLRWEEYFGGASASLSEKTAAKGFKTNMNLLLIPWIVLWSALGFAAKVGGLLGIITCSALPLAYIKWKGTVVEYCSVFMVCGISLLALFGQTGTVLLPLSYLLFGLLWTVTVWGKTPLSAYYSRNNYGGDKAMENPLFVRTNRILTGCWGIFYLVSAIWSWFLLQAGLPIAVSMLNWILPAALGVFTLWFQKWYPAHYAKGRADRK